MATPKLPEGVPKQSQPEATRVRTPRSAAVAGQIFAQLDTDGSGFISLGEFAEEAFRFGSAHDAASLFRSLAIW